VKPAGLVLRHRKRKWGGGVHWLLSKAMASLVFCPWMWPSQKGSGSLWRCLCWGCSDEQHHQFSLCPWGVCHLMGMPGIKEVIVQTHR
jgi:hypothetical protein